MKRTCVFEENYCQKVSKRGKQKQQITNFWMNKKYILYQTYSRLLKNHLDKFHFTSDEIGLYLV